MNEILFEYILKYQVDFKVKFNDLYGLTLWELDNPHPFPIHVVKKLGMEHNEFLSGDTEDYFLNDEILLCVRRYQ